MESRRFSLFDCCTTNNNNGCRWLSYWALMPMPSASLPPHPVRSQILKYQLNWWWRVRDEVKVESKHRHRQNVTSHHSFSLLWLFSLLYILSSRYNFFSCKIFFSKDKFYSHIMTTFKGWWMILKKCRLRRMLHRGAISGLWLDRKSLLRAPTVLINEIA